jgi:hypothetical protein
MNMAMWTGLGIAIGAGVASATDNSIWGAWGATGGFLIGAVFGTNGFLQRLKK